MPKIECFELTNADVSNVSFVKRGAARLPLRITKSEDENMFDLSKIGNLFKSEPPVPKTPCVVSAIVRKGADETAVKARLTAAGLNVDTRTENDALIMFAQPDAVEFDTGVVKMDDDLALVVSGLTKAFESYDFQSTDFGEVAATGSFYPSMTTALDMLRQTFGNIMHKSDTPADAAAAIGTAVDQFKAYITALSTGLPVQAFKADGPVLVIVPTAPKAPVSPAAPASTVKADAKMKSLPAGFAEMSEEDQKAWCEKNDMPWSVAKAMIKKADPVETTSAADLGAIIAQSIAAGLAPLGEQIGSLAQRVETIDQKVQKTDTTLNGFTFTSHTPDKTGEVKKSDPNVLPPLLDTAHMRTNQRLGRRVGSNH